MKKKTAKFLRDIPGFTGDARAYELSEPLEGASFVIVSATVAMFSGSETYIFPATRESLECNEPSGWLELEGSYRGGLSHERALENAGYEVMP